MGKITLACLLAVSVYYISSDAVAEECPLGGCTTVAATPVGCAGVAAPAGCHSMAAHTHARTPVRSIGKATYRLLGFERRQARRASRRAARASCGGYSVPVAAASCGG